LIIIFDVVQRTSFLGKFIAHRGIE
jgi:hypothetical protein